jgi:hypothetical protein
MVDLYWRIRIKDVAVAVDVAVEVRCRMYCPAASVVGSSMRSEALACDSLLPLATTVPEEFVRDHEYWPAEVPAEVPVEATIGTSTHDCDGLG